MSGLHRDPSRWGIIGGTGLDQHDALEVEPFESVLFLFSDLDESLESEPDFASFAAFSPFLYESLR